MRSLGRRRRREAPRRRGDRRGGSGLRRGRGRPAGPLGGLRGRLGWAPAAPADNGRGAGAEGRARGPGARTREPGARAGAEEGSGPGTPLRFPFRGARCRRATRFPREMAAPAPLAWAAPGSGFAREKIIIIRKGGFKVKRLRRGEGLRRAPAAGRVACGARRAGPALPPRAPGRSPGAPSLPPRPPPKSRPWVSFPAFPRGGALRSCPLLFHTTMAKRALSPPKAECTSSGSFQSPTWATTCLAGAPSLLGFMERAGEKCEKKRAEEPERGPLRLRGAAPVPQPPGDGGTWRPARAGPGALRARPGAGAPTPGARPLGQRRPRRRVSSLRSCIISKCSWTLTGLRSW